MDITINIDVNTMYLILASFILGLLIVWGPQWLVFFAHRKWVAHEQRKARWAKLIEG